VKGFNSDFSVCILTKAGTADMEMTGVYPDKPAAISLLKKGAPQ
jgi:hypothetical protein